MAITENQKSICKSVFKSGKDTTTRSRFTKKWIELINESIRNGQRNNPAAASSTSVRSHTADSTAHSTSIGK